MRGEGPYPVKAVITAANNTVMSYAGQSGIVDAFEPRSRRGVRELHNPTAQLADFVLRATCGPRGRLFAAYDTRAPVLRRPSACDPAGECKSWYCVIKGLADRLGYADDFPWTTEGELYDFRLRELGITWAELRDQAPKPVFRQKPAAGQFVTASDKAELAAPCSKRRVRPLSPRYQEPPDPGRTIIRRVPVPAFRRASRA